MKEWFDSLTLAWQVVCVTTLWLCMYTGVVAYYLWTTNGEPTVLDGETKSRPLLIRDEAPTA